MKTRIPLSQIDPSPIGPPLTPEQITRAEAIYPVVSEVLGNMTLAKFLENFQRDWVQGRNQEIAFWESVAESIQEWTTANPDSAPETRQQALDALMAGALMGGPSTTTRTN